MEFYWIAGGLLALTAGAWFWWRRYAPIVLTIPAKPLSTGGRQFGAVTKSDQSLGAIGELITGVMHAQQGWRQLPSQPSGRQGLDHIFVRKVGAARFDVRLVETKCSLDGDPKTNYKPPQMADEKVIEQLEKLRQQEFEGQPYAEAATVDNLIAAINRRSVRVTKWFYAHQLGIGTTLIYSIRRDGTLVDVPPRRVKRINDAQHHLLLQTLAIGMRRLHLADGNFVVQNSVAATAEQKALEPESA